MALGDLSENAEYHMAKQRQEFVFRQLGKRMADLALINMDNIPKDRSVWGLLSAFFDNLRNVEMEYKLVTSEENDVSAAGLISTSSPDGRAASGILRRGSWSYGNCEI